MFKLPIPTRLTDYLGEAVVWTVIMQYGTRHRLNESNRLIELNDSYDTFCTQSGKLKFDSFWNT